MWMEAIVLGTFPVAMMEAYILVTGLIVVSGECCGLIRTSYDLAVSGVLQLHSCMWMEAIVLGTFPVAMMEAYILVTGLIVVSGECLWAYTYVLRPSCVYNNEMKPGNNIQALSGSGCITVTAVRGLKLYCIEEAYIIIGTFPLVTVLVMSACGLIRTLVA